MARDPIAEMGQGVREECAPEKVRHVVVPAHACSLLAAEPSYCGSNFSGAPAPTSRKPRDVGHPPAFLSHCSTHASRPGVSLDQVFPLLPDHRLDQAI